MFHFHFHHRDLSVFNGSTLRKTKVVGIPRGPKLPLPFGFPKWYNNQKCMLQVSLSKNKNGTSTRSARNNETMKNATFTRAQSKKNLLCARVKKDTAWYPFTCKFTLCPRKKPLSGTRLRGPFTPEIPVTMSARRRGHGTSFRLTLAA